MTIQTPTADQLATMQEIAGRYGSTSEARTCGYIALDGYTVVPEGVVVTAGDQVVVRGRGNQWRRGLVVGLGRTRIMVGTFNRSAALDQAVRVASYPRAAVMLATHTCTRCGSFIHPVYDDLDAVDVTGRRYCSDTCLYIHREAERPVVGANA
jgi:ribosomal protein L27